MIHVNENFKENNYITLFFVILVIQVQGIVRGLPPIAAAFAVRTTATI